MDTAEFPTPPSKRQRTNSPEERRPPITMDVPQADKAKEDAHNVSIDTALTSEQNHNMDSIGNDGDGLLDVLMQHVEAETTPTQQATALSSDAERIHHTDEASNKSTASRRDISHEAAATAVVVANTDALTTAAMNDHTLEDLTATAGTEVEEEATAIDAMAASVDPFPDMTLDDTAALIATEGEAEAILGDATAADAVAPPDALMGDETLQYTIATTRTEGQEWEYDSSPISSDTESSDDSSSNDSDADDEYAMMDPAEAARMLMEGDAGSDDEGKRSNDKSESAGLRTANEKPEEVIPKPNISVTEDMHIEELGKVEATIEATVLIKAKVSGDYQVLESGSVLCLKDRTVLGVVSETLGRVEQPLYTVRFTNDKAIEEAGMSIAGTPVYYIKEHSTFVFTQPLKGIKGSDASNFHDEEVGEDEMEFSDDEAEAAYKRRLKERRHGKRDEAGRGRGGGRGGRGGYRGDRRGSSVSAAGPSNSATSHGRAEINYDDVDNGPEEGYTPLARPANLQDMMSQNKPTEEGSHNLRHPLPPAPIFGQQGVHPGESRGRGRGRGDRGRGGRGNFRGNRGGAFQHNQNHNVNNMPPPPQTQQYAQQYPSGNAFHNSGGHQTYLHPNQGHYQYPPPPPSINPQQSPYSMPFSPSIIPSLPQAGQQWQQPYLQYHQQHFQSERVNAEYQPAVNQWNNTAPPQGPPGT